MENIQLKRWQYWPDRRRDNTESRELNIFQCCLTIARAIIWLFGRRESNEVNEATLKYKQNAFEICWISVKHQKQHNKGIQRSVSAAVIVSYELQCPRRHFKATKTMIKRFGTTKKQPHNFTLIVLLACLIRYYLQRAIMGIVPWMYTKLIIHIIIMSKP